MARWPLNQVDRFWSQVKKVEGEGCWEWIGSISSGGYGRIHFDGWLQQAQRVSWLITHGAPRKEDWILHRCDNRRCVRPDHLFLGDNQDNVDDCRQKQRHAFGKRNGQAKLTKAQVIAIKADRRPQYLIASQYGINQSNVSRIKRGERRVNLQHEQ